MDFGITTTGFNKPTLNDVKNLIKADIISVYSDADFNSSTGLQQLMTVFSNRLYDLYDLYESLYLIRDVNQCTGIALDYALTLLNMQRKLPTYSYILGVYITGGGDGDTVPTGTIEVRLTNNTAVTFTNTQDYVLDSSGSAQIVLQSSVKGAMTGLIENLEVISTYNGVSVAFTQGVTSGQDLETDNEFLIRKEKKAAVTLSSTEAGIRNALLVLNDTFKESYGNYLTYIDVVSNRMGITDSRGRPPHSVEVIVKPLDEGSFNSSGVGQLVADTIYTSVGGGITIYGANSDVYSVVDDKSRTHNVQFTKPVAVSIAAEVVLYPLATLSTEEEDALRTSIKESMSAAVAALDIGQNVVVIGNDGLSSLVQSDLLNYATIALGKEGESCDKQYIDINDGDTDIPEYAELLGSNVTVTVA